MGPPQKYLWAGFDARGDSRLAAARIARLGGAITASAGAQIARHAAQPPLQRNPVRGTARPWLRRTASQR